MTEQTDCDKEIVVCWLNEHDKMIPKTSNQQEADISVKFIELVGNIRKYKQHPRNRFQTCANFTAIIDELNNRNISMNGLNPYKMACGNYSHTVRLNFLVDLSMFDKKWRLSQLNQWKDEKIGNYGRDGQ